MAGILYIVATPIGNLGDITYRAIETLKKVDLIVCEDTRRTGLLLQNYDIKKPMLVLNEFNEVKVLNNYIDELQNGNSIALLSDAGTPTISDPGFKLIRGAIEKSIRVESIPGSSSVISSLVVSGLPTDKFMFLGFLPKKPGHRKELLKNVGLVLEKVKQTIIIFESPHRLAKTLEELKKTFGDINIVIARELTKVHEEVRREKISESLIHFEKIIPKGEITILFHL